MRTSYAIRAFLSGAALALCACGPEEQPPPGSLSLAELLHGLETRQAGVLAEIEYQKDAWDAIVCGGEGCERIWLDPKTGAETLRGKVKTNTDLPPADVPGLPAAVRALEGKGLGVLTEIEFDNGEWEADFVQDGRKVEYRMDPRTGEIRRS